MIGAVLFDFGGTLDGDGLHWLDRFYAIWADVAVPAADPSRVKDAFYAADRALEADHATRACGFAEMMKRHAAAQLDHLGLDDDRLASRVADAFTVPAVAALRKSRDVLTALHDSGYRLAVVSNFYGNVATLCEEAGLTPMLEAVVDSAVVGVGKPDPRIFRRALDRLQVAPDAAVMVGDSFDRDIRPARSLGMKTLWLAPGRASACPDPALVDGVIDSVADVPVRLAAWRRHQ
jgi:HAD superfamily hydrolase (TIGR01509 family)